MATLTTELGGAGVGQAGLYPAGLAGDVAVVLADTTAPVVANFVPEAGTLIARTDAVQFDVTDETGKFARIVVFARFPDGTCECVWDGDSFAPFYGAGSSRVPIDCGFRFSVRRISGWLGSPVTIEVTAIDASGNVDQGDGEFPNT